MAYIDRRGHKLRTQVRDYMGRTFPTKSDMVNYYGIGKGAFQNIDKSGNGFEYYIRRSYPRRTFGHVYVVNVLTFPYMLVIYNNEEYVWTLEQVLNEYHSNGFFLIPCETRPKKNIQIKTQTGMLQYAVVCEDGTEQIWDYWTLIKYYRSVN